MSTATRARGPLAKAARRAQLLAAAARRFDAVGFEATTMAEVAEAAGISKGATYLYFPSKESLFLRLLLIELSEWTTAAIESLDATRSRSTRAAARLLAGSLAARPRLPALLSLLAPVLAARADVEAVVEFERKLLERMRPLGARLEERLPDLRPGEGVRLLLRARALAVGLAPLATVPGPVRSALAADSGLVALEVDFERELADCLTALIDGWR